MTSWLNTKSFMSSLAKTAMEEAQKTIDRALEIKDEYEAQESAALAAGGGNAASQMAFDVDGGLWGSYEEPKEEIKKVPHSSSEPVSLQPKATSDDPLLAVVVRQTKEPTENSLIKADSSSLMEGSGELNLEELQEASNLESDQLELHVVTSVKNEGQGGILQAISPDSMSSIEVLTMEQSGTKDSFNSSTTSTLTNDAGFPGVREPGEGQENTSESPNGQEAESNAGESSSSKSYELIKTENSSLGSKKVSSGHTSGDECCTSSDIEIISNSMASEASGGKVFGPSPTSPPNSKNRKGHKIKGHLRTGSDLSEASSQSEVDRLLKKLSEMTEILEARESKMVEMSRANFELLEKSTDLASQVKEAKRINARLQEANLNAEEFTQRLSTLEAKHQQVLDERDRLKTENEKMKKDSALRMSRGQVDELLNEKEEVIKDLMKEGEKLSKQVGKHSEITKKLRAKEKSLEKELKSAKEKLDKKIEECDRLAKNLSNKNEMESKQIDAVRDLTSANSKWEEEANKLTSSLEDSRSEVKALRLSLEGAKREIIELKRGLAEKESEEHEIALHQEQERCALVEKQLKDLAESSKNEIELLLLQVSELRGALTSEERQRNFREAEMRRERDDLLSKLADSERRHEELSGSLSSATRPLLRQIESLQSSLSESQSNADRVERNLADRLQQTSLQLASSQERERNASEQYRLASSKVAGLESKVGMLKDKLEEAEDKVEVLESEKLTIESNKRNDLNALKKLHEEQMSEIKCDKDKVGAVLLEERSELSRERKKNEDLLRQIKDRDQRLKDAEVDLRRYSEMSRGSPTLSVSSAQHGPQDWFDEMFESASLASGSKLNAYDSARYIGGNTTAMLEALQAQIKQKEGETVQLQMEISGLERVKEGLSTELGKASAEAEKVPVLEQQIRELNKKYTEVEGKYQTMLTMYGEKMEETEELRLDLLEVKEMYKEQIQELLSRPN